VNKDELLNKVMERALYPYVLNALQGKEFSKAYYGRPDQKVIENDAKKSTAKLANIIVQKIKTSGKEQLSEIEFSKLVKEAVKTFTVETNEHPTDYQRKR